jgi:hypothetical protein
MTAEMAEANIRLYRRHGFEIVGRGLSRPWPSIPHARVSHGEVVLARSSFNGTEGEFVKERYDQYGNDVA